MSKLFIFALALLALATIANAGATGKTNALTIALKSNAAATAAADDNAAAATISCDACMAKLDDLPADDAIKICQKVLKCKAATPSVAPQAMAVAAAAAVSCDACVAKLDDLPADDALKICQKVFKCKAAVPTVAPQPTTAAPQAAPTTAAPAPTTAAPPLPPAVAAMTQSVLLCDKCNAELVANGVPSDDAAKICSGILKCTQNSAPVHAKICWNCGRGQGRG